jgi:hypothetical protein
LEDAASAHARGDSALDPRTWVEQRDRDFHQAALLLCLVSHVLIFVQDGPLLDPCLFRTLRTLQAAKVALTSAPAGGLVGLVGEGNPLIRSL